MKRWLTGVFLLVLVLLTVSGCKAGDDRGEHLSSSFKKPQYNWGKSTGEKLVIWANPIEIERIYMKRALGRYQDLTGNELEIVKIPQEQFESKARDAFQGNGERPDVLLSYGGTNIESYHPDENFYNFTDAEWVEDLTDTSINQTIYNGKVIGLPHWEASISGTLYNKEIFKKYGIEVPKTQAEFLKACEILLKNEITPVYLPAAQSSMLLYQFPLDLVIQDSERLKALNNQTLCYADIPEIQQIVEWYKMMAEKGYFGEDYENNQWDGMSEALESEKYAMMFCWDTWLYTDFQGEPSRFGIMPAFIGIPERGTFEGPNLALLIVNKKSQRLQAALNFITFMADPYNYNAAFEGIYTAPVFKNQVASISTPQYIESERLIDRNYCDSTAWLRIRGFSQTDASCILRYMKGDNETAGECLREMDILRERRLSQKN